MSEAVNVNALVLLLAERLRDLAARQGGIPFRTGFLRKSVADSVRLAGRGVAAVGSNLPYARAVHDGRPRLTIRPRRKKALSWPEAKHPVKKVVQPPREGKPFFREALAEMRREGFDWLKAPLMKQIERNLAEAFPKKIVVHVSL